MVSEKVRAHVFIEGFVQGVSYRFWTQREAESLGLSGWVRNLTNGRVEVVVEGPKDKVKKMVEMCKKGPSFSKVKHTDISWEDATGEFDSFVIEYTA